jgi:hypothetical protein
MRTNKIVEVVEGGFGIFERYDFGDENPKYFLVAIAKNDKEIADYFLRGPAVYPPSKLPSYSEEFVDALRPYIAADLKVVPT